MPVHSVPVLVLQWWCSPCLLSCVPGCWGWCWQWLLIYQTFWKVLDVQNLKEGEVRGLNLASLHWGLPILKLENYPLDVWGLDLGSGITGSTLTQKGSWNIFNKSFAVPSINQHSIIWCIDQNQQIGMWYLFSPCKFSQYCTQEAIYILQTR